MFIKDRIDAREVWNTVLVKAWQTTVLVNYDEKGKKNVSTFQPSCLPLMFTVSTLSPPRVFYSLLPRVFCCLLPRVVHCVLPRLLCYLPNRLLPRVFHCFPNYLLPRVVYRLPNRLLPRVFRCFPNYLFPRVVYCLPNRLLPRVVCCPQPLLDHFSPAPSPHPAWPSLLL